MTSRPGAIYSLIAFAVALGIATAYLSFRDQAYVGTQYAAKIVCSNVFIAHRDGQSVLADDVQAPGVAVLESIRVRVDPAGRRVTAAYFGWLAESVAVHRPGTGCASAPGEALASALAAHVTPPAIAVPPDDRPWPAGSQAEPDATVTSLLANDSLVGPGMRAVAVARRGHLVGERYAPGFDHRTPLLGWSMTKTANAVLVGMAIGDGKLALEQAGFWPDGDPRAAITLADLLAMQGGLRWDEGYGTVSDVTRMLFLEGDMAAYVHSRPAAHPPGTAWNYSSGTSVLLARLWQDAVDPPALAFPYQRLFAPLGMASATLEADAHGTYVASSFMYASAPDWARLGQLLVQDGVWNGERLLPAGFVKRMAQPAAASGGEYGQGQVWLRPQGKAAADGLPADTFTMEGHDGQYVFVIPSRELVVVRLGLTPHRLGYNPDPLVVALLHANG